MSAKQLIQNIWKKIKIRFCLFRCKIFSIVKCFRMKMIFFFLFSCIPKNVPKNILQYCAKDRAEWMEGEACVFRKWFTKIYFVNHFSNFNKGFSNQRTLFSYITKDVKITISYLRPKGAYKSFIPDTCWR